MRQTFHNKIVRKTYGKLKEVLDISNLIEIQFNSYEIFLQKDIPAGRAGQRGASGGLHQRLPHKGLARDDLAGVRPVRDRRSEIFRGGVRRPGSHLCLPHEGYHTARRIQHRSEHQDKRYKGCKGTGRLFRGDTSHDGEGDVHHQRDRAGHRQPTAPLARRLLRLRPVESALQRQLRLYGKDNPVPGLLARFRIRPQRTPLRAYRQAEENSRNPPSPGAGLFGKGDSRLLL